MLGCMELKEPVQGIAIAPTVLVKSPLSWSKENALALATQMGTYIFEIKSNCNGKYAELHYERTFFSPPKESNPYISKGKQLDLINILGKENAFKLMLDDAFSSAQRGQNELTNPHMNPALGGVEPNHVGYCKAIWSPVGLSSLAGSLLCMVTYDHQIRIVGDEIPQWKLVCDLSSLWYDYLQNAGKSFMEDYLNQAVDVEFGQFVAMTKLFIVSEALWTPTSKEENGSISCHLLVITGSNHLLFWKFPSKVDNPSWQPFLTAISNIETEKIASSHWLPLTDQKGFLLLGTQTGDVYFYSISFEASLPSISFLGNPKELGHGIATNFIEMSPVRKEENLYLAVLGKHNILMVALVYLDEQNVQLINTVHTFIGTLVISGINLVCNECLYVSVKDKKIKEIHLDIDSKNQTISILREDVVLSSAGVVYTGFAVSPNKSMWAVLESVSLPYDHLILRETSVINIYIINQIETLCDYVNIPQKSLNENLDVMESIWLLGCKKNSLPLATLQDDTIPELHPLLKRYWLWLCKFQSNLLENADKQLCKEKEELLYRDILLDWVREHLLDPDFDPTSFLQNGSSNLLRLSSLANMLSLLELVGAIEPNNLTILKECIDSISGTEEKCLICQKEVSFSQLLSATCPKGHSLPRCPRSLLMTRPILQCLNCSLFYHPNSIEWFGTTASRCLICNKYLKWRIVKGQRMIGPIPSNLITLRKRRAK